MFKIDKFKINFFFTYIKQIIYVSIDNLQNFIFISII